MIYLCSVHGEYKKQALYKITWQHPEPKRNCLKLNVGLDDS